METPATTGSVVAGRYELAARIGVGGMAEVYDAVDQRLHRPVAVKLLRPQLAVQPELRHRFEAEARMSARISHPNVVAVYDTGDDEGRAFIVMERVPGESLGGWLQRGPLDQKWVRGLAEDILAALAAAHHAGVLHRDIKPANILITADGRAKVTDFGIAKTVEATAPDLTATGLVIGTPAYLAPERLQGWPATPQSDLYAAGMVLYEALTGYRRPLGADPVANAAVLGQPLPDTRTVRPDADPSLVAAIERAVATNPTDRWPTAAAMAAALAPTQAIPIRPAATQALPFGAVAASASRRHGLQWRLPAAAVVAVAVLLSMTLLLASGSHQAKRPRRSTTPAAPTTTAPAAPTTTTVPTTTTAPVPTTVAPATPATPVTSQGGGHGHGHGGGGGNGGGGGGGD